MSYTGFFLFDQQELVHLGRTASLAEAMGITSLWLRSEDLRWWIGDDNTSLADVTNAPWYDPMYPASEEFAGVVPLGISGLDDSSFESTPVEYLTAGGHNGKGRHATRPLVWNVAIVAKTERGAEFGYRWLSRSLSGPRRFTPSLHTADTYSGATLYYMRNKVAGDFTLLHVNNVRLTRGVSLTRKRIDDCSSIWTATFTLTAADPYEYETLPEQLSGLGSSAPSGGLVEASGSVDLVETGCPRWDYSPVYDPAYPALVEPPKAPNLTPAGWDIETGMSFKRYWARLKALGQEDRLYVPRFIVSSVYAARRIRLSIWLDDTAVSTQCDPLWTAIIGYVPPNKNLHIDGERKAAYIWNTNDTNVRRADTLVFGPDATPIEWRAFSGLSQYGAATKFRVTMDVFATDTGYEGNGDVRASLQLVRRSD